MPEGDPCQRFRDQVEAFADGEAPLAEAAFLRRHAAGCPACREELVRARELARQLRQLPLERCPPRVTAAVLARAGADAGGGLTSEPTGSPRPMRGPAHRRRHPAFGSRRAGGRLALAAAAAAAVAAGVLLVPRPAPPPALNAAELARTQEEVKLAFAYIGRVGRQAGDRVSAEVVHQVLVPTRRALGLPEEPRPRGGDAS